MTQKTTKIESANTDREQFQVKETGGSEAGTGMRDKHTTSSRQDSTTAPARIPNIPMPADKPASTGIDATSSTPGETSEEATARANSVKDASVLTPANLGPRVADKRLPRQTAAKSVPPQTRNANPETPPRATGPKTAAGKRRASHNSYKEGFYTGRLYPTQKEWQKDGKDYQAISVGVHEYYEPVGFWEMFWAEQIAAHAVRHARSIGYQQSVLGSAYAFSGTELNTAQRHESAAFNRMRQAIEMLESIQAKRKADSGQLQPAGSDREHVSETSNSPASSPSESFEIVADCADENKPHAGPSGPDDVVDVSQAAGDEAGSGYLYQGPPDRGAVSSTQQGRVSSSGTTRVRKPESVLGHTLADVLDRMNGREPEPREPEPVRFPNSARESVGTNPTTAFVKPPSKANSKEDKD
jgi:hypothetical protein